MGSGNVKVRRGNNIKIKETVPTDSSKNNSSFSFNYDGSGNLINIDTTIETVTYRRTLTYDVSENLTHISVWTQV